MSNLLINQIPIEINQPEIDLFFYFIESPYSMKKTLAKLKSVVKSQSLIEKLNDKDDESLVYINFESGPTESEKITLSLFENPYFIKPYIETMIYQYLNAKGLMTSFNFVRDIEIWEKRPIEVIQRCDSYDVYTLKVFRQREELTLMISHSGERVVFREPISALSRKDGISKVLYRGKVKGYSRLLSDSTAKKDEMFPIINRELERQMGLKRPYRINQADYVGYHKKIQSLYERFFKGQSIGKIKILASGFKEVADESLLYLGKDKNHLIFKDNNFDVNIYNGINRYGPFKTPDNASNIRFIFIFSEKDKSLANDLFRYLKVGFRNFPGLSQFIGIELNLDKEKSVIFKNESNPIQEIREHLNRFDFSGQKYIALYISPYSKLETEQPKFHIYHELKELLLSKNVSSQVIYKEHIKLSSFNFYLPNIALGLLAKAGGIPWKLDRKGKKFLLIGFGSRRVIDRKFIGNTVCFTNEGIFHKFDAFSVTAISQMGSILEESIKAYLAEHGEVSRLVIHYDKVFNTEEEQELQSIFSRLQLDIPYVVLTLSDRADDFVCFDSSYNQFMPVSGTIVKIKQTDEYLLFCNTRYEEKPTTKVDYTWPVKIKISCSKHVDISSKEVLTELIDEVYQFSRMYWRSIKQRSIPVTIGYSKRIADMVSCFHDNKLPNTEVASRSLWFI